MRPIIDPEPFSKLILWICQTPFIATPELELRTKASVDTLRRELRKLREDNLVASVRVGTATIDAVPRYYPTVLGIASAASTLGLTMKEFRREYPVSREWLEILLGRLDSVIACYRLSRSIAEVVGQPHIHLGRASIHGAGGPYDGVFQLVDGRTIGVIRQGTALLESALDDVLMRLGDFATRPGAVLIISPTKWHRQRVGRLVERRGLESVYVATEWAAVNGSQWNEPIWNIPNIGPWMMMTLAEIVERAAFYVVANEERTIGELSDARRSGLEWNSYAFFPTVGRTRAAMEDPQFLVSRAPAANLRPAEKRILDMIAACPGIRRSALIARTDNTKGWISRVLSKLGSRWELVVEDVDERDPGSRRLSLSEAGCDYMARRDRVHTDAARAQWSRVPNEEGRHTGRLAEKARRLWVHQDGVYESVAHMGHGGGHGDQVLWVASEVSATYKVGTADRVITPDAIGALVTRSLYIPFFLEFERTAVYPSRIPSRLERYRLLLRDSDAVRTMAPFPFVLFTFPTESAEDTFLHTIVDACLCLPVLTSNLRVLRKRGGLGDSWRRAWPILYPEDVIGSIPDVRGWDALDQPRLVLEELRYTAWSRSIGKTLEVEPGPIEDWPRGLPDPARVALADHFTLSQQ